MTSLSSQLKSLQIPDDLAVLNIQDKRASILFDSNDAADIDLDTIYSLGKTGLDELENIDPDFVDYESTLFNENFKGLERTQQPTDFNKKIDKKIKEFLINLSPYFLIKPAQKVLEWLIRRFKIHVFNVDDLMACILPYHETNLFARVVQIISLQKKNIRWQWLLPVQKVGSPLSKITLIQHCVHDLSFQSFVCEMIPQAIEARRGKSVEKFKTLFSFYASVLLGIVESSKNCTETRVGKILPFIYKGLKSNIDDYKSSTYIVLSQLCLSTTLDEVVAQGLIMLLLKSLSGETAKYGIITLEFLCKKQNIRILSTKAVKKICSSDEYLQWIWTVSDENDLSSFQVAFLISLVKIVIILTQSSENTDDVVDYGLVMNNCLQRMNLKNESAKFILQQFLDHYIKIRSVSTDSNSLMTSCQKFLETMERRYPEVTDAVLQEYFGKDLGSGELKWIEELVLRCLKSGKYKVLPETETILAIGLYHPNPNNRKLAVKELINMARVKGEGMDLEYVRACLIERLEDDDSSVVEEILTSGSVLLDVLEEKPLLEIWQRKLSNMSFAERMPMIANFLNLFKDHDFGSFDANHIACNMIYELIPSFLPSKLVIKDQLPQFEVFCRSSFAANNPFIDGIRSVLKDSALTNMIGNQAQISDVNVTIAERVAKNLIACNEKEAFLHSAANFAKTLTIGHPFRVFLFSVLCKVIDLSLLDDISSLKCQLAELIITTTDAIVNTEGKTRYIEAILVNSNTDDLFVECMKNCYSRKLDSQKGKDLFPRINIFCLFLKKIIEKTSIIVKEQKSAEEMNSSLEQFIFEILAVGSGRQHNNKPYVMVLRCLLQHFIKLRFENLKALLDFLSSVLNNSEQFHWLIDRNHLSNKTEVQVCALHIFKVCLEALTNSAEATLSLQSNALPTLIVLLNHPQHVIREASMGCIQALNDASSVAADDGLKYFISMIVSNDLAIVEDSEQICCVLEKLFKPISNVGSEVEMLDAKQLEDLRFITKYLAGFVLRSENHLRLGIATVTKNVRFQEFLLHLLPAVEDLITSSQTTGLSYDDFLLLRILLQKFEPSTVGIFEKFPLALKLFKTALSLGKICQISDVTLQEIAVNQIDPIFYSSIQTSATKSEIFDAMLNSAVTTSSTNVAKSIREKLIELPLSSDDIAKQISSISNQDEHPKKAKRARRGTKSKVICDEKETFNTLEWQQVMVLLEVLQQNTNVQTTEELILSLFEMLSRCLEISTANQPSVEYTKQLLLQSLQRCLENIINSGERGTLPQEKFNISNVIECCRTSENPQTHHQALLLLGKAAFLYPDLVLHNIMTIFTFMGANVLRQDDSYSFEVIKTTIDAVVPTLLMAGSNKSGKSTKASTNTTPLDDIVKLVIRVFVDAVPYVPEHRRLVLFEHLSSVLNAEKNLYIVLATLLEKLFMQIKKKTETEGQATDGSSLSEDFCVLLIKQFPVQIEVKAIEKLTHFVSNIPDEKPDEMVQKRPIRSTRSQKITTGDLVPLFDTAKYSTREIKQFKYNVVGYISGLLSNENFIDKASNGNETEMGELYLRLLEEVMIFVNKLGKNVEKFSQDPSLKFWKALLLKGCELIDKVYKLFTFDTFINITRKLLLNDNSTIRKKAIELIGEKVTSSSMFNEEEELMLLKLTEDLVGIIKHESIENPINKQTALYALKLLIRVLSANHSKELAKLVPIIIELYADGCTNQHVAASALLCLAELCSCLQAKVIPHLPNFMPPLLSVFDGTQERNDLLLLSGITALHKILESIPKFLSPYLVNILDIVTRKNLGASVSLSGSVKNPASVQGQIKSKVLLIQEGISKLVAPRILLPAFNSCFDQIINSEKHSIQSWMEILQFAAESLPRDEIKTHNVKILLLFLKAFDVRSLKSDKPLQELKTLEGIVVNAFATLVMKMSENLFRPMFLKISSWATTNEDHKDRLITFYRICNAIAEKLKGLFLLFAGQILRPCAELTSQCYIDKEGSGIFGNDAEAKIDFLLRLIFDCLQKCFAHDSQGFLNKERFEYLMKPLVDQIENIFGNNAMYTERVVDHLIPCLTCFAADVSDESCWKTLNYQILLKTRNQNAKVRLSALKLLEQIHKKIGESFMVLLPETIPFLAELMEDENYEVEQQCQSVIMQMESILGESLQKYF